MLKEGGKRKEEKESFYKSDMLPAEPPFWHSQAEPGKEEKCRGNPPLVAPIRRIGA